MTAPLLDPENGMWMCPDDGLMLHLVHVPGKPITFTCEACFRSWDAVPQERVKS